MVHALFPGPHVVETGLFNSDRVRPEKFAKPRGKTSGISSIEDMRRLMARYGMELKSTHPDEVAGAALEGHRGRQFLDQSAHRGGAAKYLARVESIRTNTNPVAPSVG